MSLTIDKLKLPILNFELSDYNDNRFKKVKVWVAHTGENLNNTHFSLDALKAMSHSLSYVPIVGYVEKNSLDEDDFSDHRQRIVIEKDNIDIEYLCQPYGFIPEDSNTSIEYREGKEWLTAEGFLWTKFPKGIDILTNGNGRKSQSMEIDDVEGYVTEEGVLDIVNARFSALCILGDEVAPAMTGSTIEMFSADTGFKDEMRQMLEEFSIKGAKEVDKDNLKTPETEEEVVETEVVEEEVEATEDGTEELNEEKEAEVKEEEEKPVDATEEAEESEAKEDEEEVVEHGEVDESIDTDLAGRTADTGTTDADITNGNFADEKAAYESRITELETELAELKSYKADKEKAEKDELLESYSDRLSKEGMEEIKSNMDSLDVSSLEKEIAYSILKSETDRSTKASSVNAYSFKRKTEGAKSYGELDKFFR